MNDSTSTTKPRQACLGCRRIKVACDNPQTGEPCKRCLRLSIECVYTKSQRGRRNARRGQSSRRSASPRPSLSRRRVGESPARAVEYSRPSISPRTGSAILRPRATSLSMTELLDPAIPSTPAAAPAQAPPPPAVDPGTRRMFEDPVDIGYVTVAEAQSLVRFFHDKLNPLIALLDPQLHTLAFLRMSSILFSTVLAIASKYALPERHGTLLPHAESLIHRAINTGECNTALIQSLLILVYYKGPGDRSAWLKIGIALRLALQLRWHEARPAPLPADEGEARLLLDPERTWFCLVCFDRQYADIFGLPATIKATEYGDCEAWARSHFHLNISVDIHLACSHAMVPAHEFWARIRKEHEDIPPRLLRVLLSSLYDQTARYRLKWFPRDGPPAPTHLAPARHLMEMFALSHQLALKHHLLLVAESAADADALLPECVEHAANVVAAFEAVSRDGSPRYLHDAGATTLSNLGLVLYKLFWRLAPDARAYLVELTARARACCPPEGPLMYTARFLDRVLALFRAAVEDVPAEAGPPGQLQIDEFLRLAGGDLSALVVDDEYWAGLLSSSVEEPVYPALALGM
ncbi:hypothetical protein CspeluHIS016_0505890 [Cutaneotrichosporon spelunceum]|uniref:Zn(2)-C6 fungal-type domain-containing protein n=1 Tax=Cutaneotrichosporon spelunceum TaxID=1672016 RepID=A0AAD3TY60_9TREE|nr:hypothetical protein CspeluHIS016_0505890 [Cutaneotrichosporon spelunceum]